MDKPLLSFVLPTKNRVAWLGEAIMSLVTQNEPNIEIIVINDGSTDETKDLLESEYIKNDPRIKVVHHEESIGAGSSRNEGTELASADIVCQFDDDDMSVGDRAEKTVQWFKEHPESELVNFAYVRVGMLNEIMENFPGKEFDEDTFKKTGAVNFYCNPSVAYKKASFKETAGYGKESKEATDDYLFVDNWIKAGKKIDFCPETVVLHRVLPNSMMTQFRGYDASWSGNK